jgi:hypothetical protein
VHERYLAGKIVVVQGGQKPQFDKELESITNAQDQTASVDERHELLDKRFVIGIRAVFPAYAGGLGGAEVVSVKEAAWENEKVVPVKAYFAAGQVGKVNDIGLIGTGFFCRVRTFNFAVGAVSGEDKGVNAASHVYAPWGGRSYKKNAWLKRLRNYYTFKCNYSQPLTKFQK